MTTAEERARLARFFDRSLEEILPACLGREPPPARREIVTRLAALVVDRFCLDDQALFWEDLSRTPYGLCAVLDGLDSLEHASLHLLRTRGGGEDSLADGQAIRRGLDDLRAQVIRLSRSGDVGFVLDPAALDRVPDPLFVVATEHTVEGINAAARKLLGEGGGAKCHGVLFGRAEPCDGCPLPEVVGHWRHGACAGNGEGAGGRRSVGLSPLTQTSAVAYLTHPAAGRDGHADAAGAGLVENIGSGVLFVDGDGTVRFANRAAKELLGPALGGARLASLLPEVDLADDGRQRKLSVRRGRREVQIGYRCVTGVLEGRRGTVVSFRDITELLRMQADIEQMKRLSEIGRMCAVVAHEIRNPLAGIVATIQSIEREASAAGLQEPLAVVLHEVNRLGDLLTSFFGFVRQPPPRRRLADVRALVQRAGAGAGNRLQGITVEVGCPDVLPAWIDADQVQQVLLNLLLNAADAAGSGGRIAIRAGIVAGRLVLRVEDDGGGIAPEDLEHVFDAFFSTKPGGAGLGLSICYRIVAAHGGSIDIDSAPGRGTRVEVVLPLGERPRD